MQKNNIVEKLLCWSECFYLAQNNVSLHHDQVTVKVGVFSVYTLLLTQERSDKIYAR